MARPREPLPPALPPETRTVGQLVAESIRLYGRKFWRSLALGLSLAFVNQVSAGHTRWFQLAVVFAAAPLFTASYTGASALAADVRPSKRRTGAALIAGTVAFLPAPAFALLFALPGVAWLAFVGLVVPVVVIEGLGFRAAFRRATRLARADYVHAFGSLATLAITFVLTRFMLAILLHGQADAATRVAAFLADLVLSPIMFLGAALLYFDQAARVVDSSPRPRRSRNADLRPTLEPDPPGRADAEVQSRPASQGEQ
jgi:hypothetical protein